MIEEVKMYSAVCDGCKTSYDFYDNYSALGEKSDAIESIKECDEWIISTEEKIYCPDCHVTYYDEDKDENNIFTRPTENSGETHLGVEL